MSMILVVLGILCFIVISKNKANDSPYINNIATKKVCPECGTAYYEQHEINYIENHSMCHHCLAIFDDEVRDMGENSTKEDDTKADILAASNWEDSSDNWDEEDDENWDLEDEWDD